MKKYHGDFTNQIAFPLGGIGTGSISLSGNGIIIDPEINGYPDREKEAGYTCFAIKAERDGKVLDSRILAGDFVHDYMGTVYGRYGIGNSKLSGFKHFKESVFSSKFPFAYLELSDPSFPGKVTLEAFNPFIPSDDINSSLPAAFFNITIENASEKEVKYVVFQNVSNILTFGGLNKCDVSEKLKKIILNGSESKNTDDNITAATDANDVAYTESWYRGEWFDSLTVFMNELDSAEVTSKRSYDTENPSGHGDTATLSASATLMPGEKKHFKFLISWYVKEFHANPKVFWGISKEQTLKYHYTTLFKNSSEVADYCFKNWNYLYNKTKLFSDAFASSTLPEPVADAINGNLAILKSSTCLRLEDGSFWAFEGVYRTAGSCAGTCQHVWNYSYTLPFLFPKIERKIRDNEFKYNLDESGAMHFRMSAGIEKTRWGCACVDGQMGTVIKAYREWKLSGDDNFLKKNWPDIQRCIDFAFSPNNPMKWDPQKTGVITGKQHHTLDVELFGMYSWLTGFYIAALCAGADMAQYLGDTEKSNEYRTIADNGKKILEKSFNGEYYEQQLKIDDLDFLKQFPGSDRYRDEENGQIKYQIGNGCGIDQVLADWHTNLIGLPPVFDIKNRKSALKSIFNYNFVVMNERHNPCRVFACNNEKGVTMFCWPDKSLKPKIPIPYSEECMTGFEYAVADNMLQCNMENEALEIVRAVRNRYDGKKRNPFAEIECGASYARAMASYSFLLTYSGFIYDMPSNMIGFKPIHPGKYFWSLDGAFGQVECSKNHYKFKVLCGKLLLKKFITNFDTVKQVRKDDVSVSFSDKNGKADFAYGCELSENDCLFIDGE